MRSVCIFRDVIRFNSRSFRTAFEPQILPAHPLETERSVRRKLTTSQPSVILTSKDISAASHPCEWPAHNVYRKANHARGSFFDTRRDAFLSTRNSAVDDYVKLDVDKQCDSLTQMSNTSGPASSRLVSIDKIEGDFCRALVISAADWTELVAKILTLFAGPCRVRAQDSGLRQS
jgi:hypothetical protein